MVLVAVGAYQWWSNQTITHGPGVLAPDEPKQNNISESISFTFEEYQITPMAHFEIEARVLSIEKYSWGREADLSPIDLALGWRSMSDEAVLEKISIRQSNRFYYWSTEEYPIPRKEIESNSANMHLIPASSTIAKQLKTVIEGHVVVFKGYLVKVKAGDGWRWSSSMSRYDTGKGACELIWVQEFGIQ